MIRQKIELLKTKFDLRLQDVPGLLAEPYPNIEWRIVTARNEFEALASEDEILTGISDDEGKVILHENAEKTLIEAYNDNPNHIWLIIDSHAKNLLVTLNQKKWTDKEKFYHGINALGYSDTLGITNGQSVEEFFAVAARVELETKSGSNLLNKIKSET